MIRCGQKEGSAILVLVRALENAIQDDRFAQPLGVARRFVEIQKTGNHESVVREIGVVPGMAILVTAQQALVLSHAREHEVRGSLSAPRVNLLSEYQGSPGIGRDHQPIPGSENLVVSERRWAPGTGCVEQVLGF